MKNKKVTFSKKMFHVFPSGKRGWIRILEAVIGITIVLSVLVVFHVKAQDGGDSSGAIYDLQSDILDMISSKENLRVAVLDGNEAIVRDFIEAGDFIPVGYDFGVKICDLSELSCNLIVDTEKEVYVSERIISSNLQSYRPKKVRLFVWEKVD